MNAYFLFQSRHQNVANYVESANAMEEYAGRTWNDEECTFQWVKNMLKADYPGKKVIFCKDHVRAIEDDFDRIPVGYHHTFLIRKPARHYLSLWKLWTSVLQEKGVSLDTFQLDKTLENCNKRPLTNRIYVITKSC